LLQALYDHLSGLGNKVAKLALTNTAALKIGGSTIHKFFKISIDNDAVQPNIIYSIVKHFKYVLVDEVSMIPTNLYRFLNLIKMHGIVVSMAGDFKQLKPVLEEHIDFSDTPMLFDLVEGQKLLLKHNYRANQQFADACERSEYNLEMFPRSATGVDQKSLDKLNICRSNAKRKQINEMCAKKYGKLGSVGSHVICTKNVTIDGRFFANNEMFEVVNRGSIKRLFTDEDETVQVESWAEFLKVCELAYCITTHKAQGATIRVPYTIYEFARMEAECKYTALTRTSDPNLIRIAGVRQGYIYKLTDGVKVYIGSSFTPEQRFTQHKRDSKTGNNKLYQYMRTTDLAKWEMSIIAKPLVLDRFNNIRTVEDECILQYGGGESGLNGIRAERDVEVEREVVETNVVSYLEEVVEEDDEVIGEDYEYDDSSEVETNVVSYLGEVGSDVYEYYDEVSESTGIREDNLDFESAISRLG
jgi:hypothetical protein